MGRRHLSKFLAITGLVLDIKEILVILGVPIAMMGIGGVILWFFTHVPTVYLVLILLGIFLLCVAIIMKVVSSLRKINVPNKQKLLDAIANYELRARDVFLDIGHGNDAKYREASTRLDQEMLKSGLTRIRDNPISLVVIFAGLQVLMKYQGLQVTGEHKQLLLGDGFFIGKLRGKTETAIEWLNKITE